MPTLNSHLWAISKLLMFKPGGKLSEQAFHERFLYYIIAVCHRKMSRRMNHSALSQPYLAALMRAIDVLKHAKKILNLVKHLVQSSGNFESDKGFLRAFDTAVRTKSIDLKVGAVPLLLALARNIDQRHISELFTAETCCKFHAVLAALLGEFQSYLHKLAAIHKVCTTDTNLMASRGEESMQWMHSIATCGSLLLKLARGSAITLYFQTIKSGLQFPIARTKPLNPTSGRSANEFDDASQADNEELWAVQPSTDTGDGRPTPLWKVLRDWVRLVTVQIESAEILTTHSALYPHPKEPIKLQLVVSPQDPALDERSLSWKSLFTDPLVDFPVVCSNALPVRTNKEILCFLTAGADGAPAVLDSELLQIAEASNSLQLRLQLGMLSQYFANIAQLHPASPEGGDSPAPMDAYGWGKNSIEILELLHPGKAIDSSFIESILQKSKYKVVLSKAVSNNIDKISTSILEFDNKANFFQHSGHATVKEFVVSNNTQSLTHYLNSHFCAQYRITIE